MRTGAMIRAAVVGGVLVGASIGGAQAQSTSPVPAGSPTAIHDGPLVAGTYSIAPFVGTDWDPCLLDGRGANPEQCPDPSLDDDIRFTFDVPDGWADIGGTVFRADMANEPPGGAGFAFTRGGQLCRDLCPPEPGIPEIAAGPSVDDFVMALVDHPLLDATEPVDVTLAGYSGRYLELQLPSDVTACNHFVWQPGIYARGPTTCGTSGCSTWMARGS